MKECHPSNPPSIHPSIYPSVHLATHPSIHLTTHPSIHLSIWPLIHLSIHPSVHRYTHPSIHPSIHSFIYLCICLKIFLECGLPNGTDNYFWIVAFGIITLTFLCFSTLFGSFKLAVFLKNQGKDEICQDTPKQWKSMPGPVVVKQNRREGQTGPAVKPGLSATTFCMNSRSPHCFVIHFSL